jgi:hypothetical protein
MAAEAGGDAVKSHASGLRADRQPMPDRLPTMARLNHLHQVPFRGGETPENLRPLVGRIDRIREIGGLSQHTDGLIGAVQPGTA